jgi:dephospho-CoA kinase
MLKVGLTGGIASGKTTIAGLFRRLGANVIDADEVARQVVEPGRPALAEIAESFGRAVLCPGGELDRAALGRIVFNDAEALARLNAITHPRIWEKEAQLLREYQERDPKGVTILDAAVLIEAGAADRMDVMVVLNVDEKDQLKRLSEKGMAREEALSRIRSQMPTSEKLTYADYVIDNRGSLEETTRKVEIIWEKLVSIAQEKRD